MTRVALLRHYPTDWNLERRLQGRTDRPLTGDAHRTLAKLRLPREWQEARVVTSTLRRTIDTAVALSDRPTRPDPDLVEIGWGAWEGHRAEDLAADPGSGFVHTGEMGWETRPPGGESRADAWARVQPALARIAADPEPALLVIHKAIMRILLDLAHGEGAPEVKRGRLYPLTLAPDGMPGDPGPVLRLVAR
ncbi:MAG: histidine phosphatase family protein [Pseudomonadota bacterium]